MILLLIFLIAMHIIDFHIIKLIYSKCMYIIAILQLYMILYSQLKCVLNLHLICTKSASLVLDYFSLCLGANVAH